MRRLRTFSYLSELRQFDSLFSYQRPSRDRMLRCADALASSAQPVSDPEPCIWSPSPCRSDISGGSSVRFSGASDRSHRRAPAAYIANSSKKNGMHAIGCAFPSLARMLLRFLQKKRQLKNRRREGTFRCQAAFNSSHRGRAISPVWLCASAHMRSAMKVDAWLRLGLQWRG
jgi:hypothetical protein